MSLSSTDKSEVGGNNVTEYGELSIGTLKKELKLAVNNLADNLDIETRQVRL